ncbi:MAG: hypothetical protein OEY49_16275, partial [Candidatus Heimdallarchaeota archaeon]|nr:hypothetical protein [Candidatus Heimdallarchaeota archaeon]
DRSDFGTKAVLSYIDYLSHIENFDNLAISTILKIASASKIENDDINVLKEILNDMKESN